MNKVILYILLSIVYVSYAQSKSTNFELYFSYTSLGSNLGSMQPVFKVCSDQFVYTQQQTSWITGMPIKPIDTIAIGSLRKTSLDSIVDLVANIQDSTIYKTDISIMSGGIHTLSIQTNTRKVIFELHNAHDPIAAEIIAILNSNLPIRMKKLWLFDL